MVRLSRVRELLERRRQGDALTPAEEAELTRDARILRRRLERLHTQYPDTLWIQLDDELARLAEPGLLAGA